MNRVLMPRQSIDTVDAEECDNEIPDLQQEAGRKDDDNQGWRLPSCSFSGFNYSLQSVRLTERPPRKLTEVTPT